MLPEHLDPLLEHAYADMETKMKFSKSPISAEEAFKSVVLQLIPKLGLMPLSAAPYDQVFIGMKVISWKNVPGTVADKFYSQYREGNDWITINWDNGNKSIQPHALLTMVMIEEHEL